jgi:hypothetical protein
MSNKSKYSECLCNDKRDLAHDHIDVVTNKFTSSINEKCHGVCMCKSFQVLHD